jgi:hypothetical protein
MLELVRQQVDDGLAYLGVASLDQLEPSLLDIGWASQRTGTPVGGTPA